MTTAQWIPGLKSSILSLLLCFTFKALAYDEPKQVPCEASACDLPVLFLTEHSLPGIFLDQNANLSGATVDLVHELVRRLNLPADYYLLPWARAMQRAQQSSRSVLFETVRIPEREALFHWVGPIKYFNMMLYGSEAYRGFSIENLSRTAVACGYRGASYSKALHELGFVEDTNLVMVTRAGDCLKMLELGRADVTPLNEFRHGKLFQQNDLRLVPLQPLREVELYLALSLDFTDTEVALWQQTLQQIYQDGTMRKIYQGVFPEQIIAKLEQLAAK